MYISVMPEMYRYHEESVHFAYIISLWVEGKQLHILCKPKTLLS
jgi:hypothetical protein